MVGARGMTHVIARLQRHRLLWPEHIAFIRVPRAPEDDGVALVGMVMGAAHNPRRKLVDHQVIPRLGGIALDDDLLHAGGVAFDRLPLELIELDAQKWTSGLCRRRRDQPFAGTGHRTVRRGCYGISRRRCVRTLRVATSRQHHRRQTPRAEHRLRPSHATSLESTVYCRERRNICIATAAANNTIPAASVTVLA